MEKDKPPVKPVSPNYFYLNGNLHKKLHINRGADTIMTWCYPLEKRIAYTYSHVKRDKEPCFSTMQVARMVNRSRKTVEWTIIDGNIETPQYTYGFSEHKQKFQYLWHERNVMELHAYLSTVHIGPPRKDGLITPAKLPTARELRAIMRNREILYVKDGDEFRPVWDAEDFD